MIWIILPAYNEEEALPPLMAAVDRELRAAGLEYTLVVVNDGSGDRTAEILEEAKANYPLEVVTHELNRGLWETIRDGFEYVASRAAPGDAIVRLDADLTHDPKYIAGLVKPLAGEADVAIASRYQKGGGQTGLSAYRRFISRCASLTMKTFFPIRGVRDYSCGFRAYRAEVIQKALEIYGNEFISVKGVGFTCTIEKLLRLREMGARFREVPFVLHYDLKPSQSKMLSSLTTIGYLVIILKYIYPWGKFAKEWRRQGHQWRRLRESRD